MRALEEKINKTKEKLESHGYKIIEFLPEHLLSRNLVGFAEDQDGNRCAIKFSENPKLENEFNVMKIFSNNNIISALDFFNVDDDYFGLVMPIADGGDLTIAYSNQDFSQSNIQHIMRSIFSALLDIHQHGYIHRDVKPENIFIMGKNITSQIVLADLESLIKNDGPKNFFGTENYMAPEMICRKKYDFKVDVWSAGCVMYRLYFGDYPDQHIIDGAYVDVDVDSTYNNISQTTKDFMKRILLIDPAQRLTAEEALNDPYFEQNLSITNENDFCTALNEIDSDLNYANNVGNKDVFFNAKKDNKDDKKDNKDDKKDNDDDKKDNDDDKKDNDDDKKDNDDDKKDNDDDKKDNKDDKKDNKDDKKDNDDDKKDNKDDKKDDNDDINFDDND